MVPWVVKGRVRFGRDDEPRDLIAELTVEGKTLLLPFSFVNCGNIVPCVDGRVYELGRDDDRWDDSHEEPAEIDELPSNSGETDNWGIW
jgi:hypothetical protein